MCVDCGGGVHACVRVRLVESGELSEVRWALGGPLSPSSCLLPRRYHHAAAYLAWGLIWAKSGGGHVYGKGTGCQNSGAP